MDHSRFIKKIEAGGQRKNYQAKEKVSSNLYQKFIRAESAMGATQ